jgi:pimeloyl-[acyl-carrier protein] methyl ester esterase
MIKIIIVSGWAAPKEYLDRLSDDLAEVCKVRTVSIHELSFQANGGGSGREVSDIPVSDYALGLIRMIKESGPCLLMGWSTGGMISLEAAVHLPDRVKGLILISTAARFCAAPDYPYGTSLSVVRAMVRGIRREPETTLADFFVSAHKPFNEDAALIDSEVNAARVIGRDALSAGLQYLQKIDLRDMLKSIAVPATVVHGKEDVIIPWQAGRFLADNIPDASLSLHEGAGHDLPFRFPEPVAEEVKKWLKN